MYDGQGVSSLDEVRRAVSDLPTIPESLTRILNLLEDPKSGARDLAAIIRRDPPLAAKILRLANSPLYSKQRSVTTVQECVSLLGYRTVRQVALCVAVVTTLGRECEKSLSILDYREIWRHGVATAATAKRLAELIRHPEPEEIFTCGLLHDLGKMVLALKHPSDYGVLIKERRRRGVRLVELERESLGYDHAQVGAALAETWHLPSLLAVTIGGHHDQDIADRDIGLVALADILANGLAPAQADLGFDPLLARDAVILPLLGLDEQALAERRADLTQAIAALAPLNNLA